MRSFRNCLTSWATRSWRRKREPSAQPTTPSDALNARLLAETGLTLEETKELLAQVVQQRNDLLGVPQWDVSPPSPPVGGLWRYCDLCDFKVWHDEPLVLNWAMRAHMYERHPSKGAKVYMTSLRRRRP